MKKILKVLVGSRAHGLHNEDSDHDYRGVFIQPTSEILKLGKTKRHTSWIEGKIDDTSWELGHFLQMAVKCNPTILEVFLSPIEEETEDCKELRALFPHVWNSNDVKNAFIGYGLNQRKKFLDGKDNRPNKFAAAYLRSLVCGSFIRMGYDRYWDFSYLISCQWFAKGYHRKMAEVDRLVGLLDKNS